VIGDPIPKFVSRSPIARAAFAYAERLHDGQLRAADGAPFILHPIEVATLLYEDGAPDDVVAAGVLHDTLEKTDATAYELSARFGRRVGDIVRAVTDDGRIVGYSRRKAALREQVSSAGHDALTVFAADKLSKVRELGLAGGSITLVEGEKLNNYRRCLVLLQEHLPGHALVIALQHELETFSGARNMLAHAG
jgi:(p)ppGpp synthase/HD superfamily hydrolase